MIRRRIVKPERRQVDNRPTRLAALGDVVPGGQWSDRRTQCWGIEPNCTDEWRRRCPAFFVKRNCWDLWAAEFFPKGRRPCCHPDLECNDCSIATAKFGGDLMIFVDPPAAKASSKQAEPANTYCANLYNSRESSPVRTEADVRGEFKCRRRPGILLHESYVTEVCSCLEHRDCVFYETE